MQKLMKQGEQAFLMVIRTTDDEATIKALKQKGMMQAVKREIMKHKGPTKLKTVEEGRTMQLEKVAPEHRDKLQELLDENIDLFVDKLPYGKPPDRGVKPTIELEPGAELVSTIQVEPEGARGDGAANQGSAGSRAHSSIFQSMGSTNSLRSKKGRPVENVLRLPCTKQGHDKRPLSAPED